VGEVKGHWGEQRKPRASRKGTCWRRAATSGCCEGVGDYCTSSEKPTFIYSEALDEYIAEYGVKLLGTPNRIPQSLQALEYS